jgi:hypothetical protein
MLIFSTSSNRLTAMNSFNPSLLNILEMVALANFGSTGVSIGLQFRLQVAHHQDGDSWQHLALELLIVQQHIAHFADCPIQQ